MATKVDTERCATNPQRRTAEPRILELPIGTGASGFRMETDSLGAVYVPADHYWGAQTERSLIHFAISDDHLPKAVHRAYGYVKKAAALVNADAGRLPRWKGNLIGRVAGEVIVGKLDNEFPLCAWQSGSGTDVNMNVNEVIANRAIQLVGGVLGSKQPIHPHDDVNMGQSSNDTFVTAMHIAAVREVREHLLPSVQRLGEVIREKSHAWQSVVKTGRTHLQDALPLTVGQEWSGYAAQLEAATARVGDSLGGLYQLAIGATAVGTGLNAPPGFARHVSATIGDLLGLPFVAVPNTFAALGALDAMVHAMAALRSLAVSLMKIANDIRWLASGPDCGLAELRLPAIEPGSSIMPGKVNPGLCEAVLMVCTQVLGEDAAVAFAGSQGNFELNTMRPIIIHNFLHSARILGDAANTFREHCIEGIALNRERIADNVSRSLMVATALNPVIGYDRAAEIVQKAAREHLTLREAAVASGSISREQFDEIMQPWRMVGEEGHQ